MTQDKPSNVAASVRQRLLNIIRETGDDANLVWTRYATERLLYRLSISEYAGNFILKGAMLFTAWTGQPYRPTVDMDFLGHGVVSSERLADVFRNGTNQGDGRIKGTYLSYLSNLDETPQIYGIRGLGGVSALLTSRLIIEG